ncbi:MAG TPA: hypothetical protein VMI54_22335 [Polyangiaceae bacterium]|nr:hypothetical protein [Polyangiaceae bacterium]
MRSADQNELGEDEEDRALLERAVTGETEAFHRLLARTYPVMWWSVRRKLARASSRRGARSQDASDVLQHAVFVLLRRRERVLMSFRPDGGLSVRRFFGLFAERVAASWLRSGRLSAWAEQPVAPDVLAENPAVHTGELESRELLGRVWQTLESRLDASSLELFQSLLIDDAPVTELCERHGMTPNALYCARRRFRALARAAVATELPGPARTERLPGELARVGSRRVV